MITIAFIVSMLVAQALAAVLRVGGVLLPAGTMATPRAAHTIRTSDRGPSYSLTTGRAAGQRFVRALG